MTTLSTKTLATALADLIEEAEGGGLEAAGFHEEAHFQAGLWAWARDLEPRVKPVAEAKYADARWEERCDLMFHRRGQPVAWIEIKRVWGWRPGVAKDKRWNTKPSEQLRNFLWDLARLAQQTSGDGTDGFFVAKVYNWATARFDEEVVPASLGASPRQCRRVLANWLGTKEAKGYAKADAQTRARLWADAWAAVRLAFGLPPRVDSAQLLPQLVRCLSLVAEVEVVVPETSGSILDYRAVVGRLIRPLKPVST